MPSLPFSNDPATDGSECRLGIDGGSMITKAISELFLGERDRSVVMFVFGDNEVRFRKREDTVVRQAVLI